MVLIGTAGPTSADVYSQGEQVEQDLQDAAMRLPREGYLVLGLAMIAGCQYGMLRKRSSECCCPTDIRQTIPGYVGEDAIFHGPCGPSSAYFGYKPTCWGVWPSSGAAWRDEHCGPLPAECDEQTLPPIPEEAYSEPMEPVPMEINEHTSRHDDRPAKDSSPVAVTRRVERHTPAIAKPTTTPRENAHPRLDVDPERVVRQTPASQQPNPDGEGSRGSVATHVPPAPRTREKSPEPLPPQQLAASLEPTVADVRRVSHERAATRPRQESKDEPAVRRVPEMSRKSKESHEAVSHEAVSHEAVSHELAARDAVTTHVEPVSQVTKSSPVDETLGGPKLADRLATRLPVTEVIPASTIYPCTDDRFMSVPFSSSVPVDPIVTMAFAERAGSDSNDRPATSSEQHLRFKSESLPEATPRLPRVDQPTSLKLGDFFSE